MNVSNVVAERNMLAISPEGALREFNVKVSVPFEDSDGNWYCQTDPGLGDKVINIAGVDSWQALEEAMKFCARRAKDREKQGWKYRWPDDGEHVSFG